MVRLHFSIIYIYADFFSLIIKYDYMSVFCHTQSLFFWDGIHLLNLELLVLINDACTGKYAACSLPSR